MALKQRLYAVYSNPDGWLLSVRGKPTCASCLWRLYRLYDMMIPCPRCKTVHHLACGRIVDSVCALCAEEECSGP